MPGEAPRDRTVPDYKSGFPPRSARFGPYRTAVLGTGNRVCLRLSRGTYRLQCFAKVTTVVARGVFFAVGRDDFAFHFGTTPSRVTCLAEYLGCAGGTINASNLNYSRSDFIEVDVRDGEVIWFWGEDDNEIIKCIQVGVLPPSDPDELEAMAK